VTTYYVRKTGSDSNPGTSPSQAYLTIGKALASGTALVAGDTVYIGAGTYREVITVAVAGAAGNYVNIVGDIDGSQTGDAGEVIWTNYLVDDFHSSSASATATFGAAASHLQFSQLTMVNGAQNSLIVSTAGAVDVGWTDCTFYQFAFDSNNISITSPTSTPVQWTFDRCSFWSLGGGNSGSNLLTFTISNPPGTGAAGIIDHQCVIKNCFIFTSSSTAVNVSALGQRCIGVRIYNSTIISGGFGFSPVSLLSSAVTPPACVEVHNSWCLSGSQTPPLSATVKGGLIEDNNIIMGTNVSNVDKGPGSVHLLTSATLTACPMFEGGQSYRLNGTLRPFFTPLNGSSLLAGGNRLNAQAAIGRGNGPVRTARPSKAGVPPGMPGWLPEPNLSPIASTLLYTVPPVAYDYWNRQRPSGGATNLPGVGFSEVHDIGTQDLVNYDTAPSSLKMVGPHDQEFFMPVDAASTAIAVRVRVDHSYTGSVMPALQLVANAEIGVTGQIAYAARDPWDKWQDVTLTAFTPTATGYIRIRIISYDSSGSGIVNFDTFSVT
jgi:hypothetical protein